MAAHKREFCTRGHSMAEYRKFQPNGDSYCSACKVLRTKESRKANPEKTKIYLKRSSIRRYGIEPEQYEKMIEQCNGKCMLCGSYPGIRSLHIDHDHKTGVVRGLLCHNCNTALGLLKEDIELFEKAISYLKVNK